MARTYKWPIEINNGIIPLMDDSEESRQQALEQTIVIYILPSKTTNPFLKKRNVESEDMTFKSSDDAKSYVAGRIKEIFDILEYRGRARLRSTRFFDPRVGEVFVVIEFDDIEMGAIKTLIRKVM